MFRHYLLTAYKVFMRRKLFTAINLLCIVLTLVVLMVITALLETAFSPRGVEGKSDRFLQVVAMRAVSPDGESVRIQPLGMKLIDQYLRPLPSVERVAAVTMPRATMVYQEGRMSELQMRRADANYWTILDFTLLDGRLPDAGDDQHARMVAVLNRSSARRLFGTQAAAGKSLTVGGQQLQVIGVVEDEMHINAFADIWAPIATMPSTDYRMRLEGDFTALLLARDAGGLQQIRADVAAAAQRVQFDDPRAWNKAQFWADGKLDAFARLTVGSPEEEDSGGGILLAIILTFMVLFMLLPALNLVNLNTGRILERSTEIGVRKAFGATSMQLAGQLIVENVLLCLVAGVLALLCSQLVLMWIEQMQFIPYLRLSLNLPVMAYGLLIAVFFGLMSGVIPAWKMSRLDPVHALKGAV